MSDVSGLLTFTITLPIIGALLLLLIPNRDGAKDGVIRYTALGVSLLTFVLTLLATSLSDSVKSVDEVGVKGELANILETFEPEQR